VSSDVRSTGQSRHAEDSQMPWNSVAERYAAVVGQRDQERDYRAQCDYEIAVL